MIRNLVLCTILGIVWSHPSHMECIFEKSVENCCHFPNSTKDEAADAAMDECDKQFATKHDFKCAVECFLNKTKVMVDGKIDLKGALDIAEFTAEEKPVWDPIMENAVKKCTEWAEAESFKPMPEHPSQCTFKAAFFVNCLMGQMFLNCPANIWKSDDTCDAAKATVEKCRVLIVKPSGKKD